MGWGRLPTSWNPGSSETDGKSGNKVSKSLKGTPPATDFLVPAPKISAMLREKYQLETKQLPMPFRKHLHYRSWCIILLIFLVYPHHHLCFADEKMETWNDLIPLPKDIQKVAESRFPLSFARSRNLGCSAVAVVAPEMLRIVCALLDRCPFICDHYLQSP